jgi:hypothetical protein
MLPYFGQKILETLNKKKKHIHLATIRKKNHVPMTSSVMLVLMVRWK